MRWAERKLTMKKATAHISHTHAERIGVTWCERRIELEFVFQSIDHAAYSQQQGSRIIICKDCLAEIILALSKGEETV